jgi:transcriptional regulator with XRE-family HTH domain/mannose-6-phosphate isomerase-like protein (cupin superfamily)
MANTARGAARPEGTLGHQHLGAQVRAERQRRALSVRELARRIGVSASLISQVETGRAQPSVTTLMALVTELELSLDSLFSDGVQTGISTPAAPVSSPDLGVPTATAKVGYKRPRQPPGVAESPHEHQGTPSALLPVGDGTSWANDGASWAKSSGGPFALAGPWIALGVERTGKRAFLELESGVRWERLTPHSLPGMEFLHVRYEPGASSTAHGKHTRHEGIEFGYVTTGILNVTVGFDEMVLETGDSIMFDAATPHRLENRGRVATEAVWLILGRQSLGAPRLHQG